MKRLAELDILRLVALFLLFIFHSALSTIYPDQLWFVQMYLLASFFIVSGFLFRVSVENDGVMEAIGKKFWRIYVPLILSLFMVFATGMFSGIESAAYLYHATGLSIFKIFQAGSLNMFHLWYLVQIMAYFIIFLGIWKAAQKFVIRFSIVIAIFFLMIAANSINSPLSLEWKFMFFFPIFYLGMELGGKGILQKIYNTFGSSLLVPATALALMVLSMMNTPAMSLQNPEAMEFVNMTIFIIIRNAFCISSCLLSLWIFTKIKSRFIVNAAAVASYGMLFAYIIQPSVSFGASLFFSPLAASIPIAFMVALAIGYAMQRVYDFAIMYARNLF